LSGIQTVSYVEWFNGKFREECLNQQWFETLAEARDTIETWRVEYNTERPHRALGQQTPAAAHTGWTAVKEAPG
jgi:putative transposase